MSRFSFAVAASAVIFFCGSAAAARLEFPEVKETKPVSAPLKGGATVQAAVSPVLHSTDFDVFSVIDDPLYREGSILLLEKAVKEDAAKKSAPSEKPADLRDAPASKPSLKKILRVKKTKAKKPVHSDPVKLKNSL